MIELTARQVSDLLRKCSTEPVCEEGCPLHAEHPKCVRTLMQSAAGMIDDQGQLIDEQEALVAKLREIIAKHKIK